MVDRIIANHIGRSGPSGMVGKRLISTVFMGFAFVCSFAQDWKGIGQVGVIVPNSLVGFHQTQADSITEGRLSQKAGFQFGGLLQRVWSDKFTLTFGLLLTDRHFEFKSSSGTIGTNFRSFEVPLEAGINMRLAERLQMSNELGFSLDFFPSDVAAQQSTIDQQIFIYRRSWVYAAATARHGYAYTTEKLGHYFGLAVHVPFGPMSQALLMYHDQTQRINIQASYALLVYRLSFKSE